MQKLSEGIWNDTNISNISYIYTHTYYTYILFLKVLKIQVLLKINRKYVGVYFNILKWRMFKAKITATIFWVYNINRGKEHNKEQKWEV